MKQWTPLFGAAIAAATFACSDSSDGDAGGADAGGLPDAVVNPDATIVDGGRVDTGIPRPDAGLDAGEYFCVTANQITVGGADITVGESSMPAMRANNTRADLSCIDNEVEEAPLGVPIFIRGCYSTAGAAFTEAELDQLEIAVFPATFNDATVDPSYDFVTRADREPLRRIEVGWEFESNVPENTCASRVQLQIGFDSPGAALMSEEEYIVRVRTSSSAVDLIVPTTYYYGLVVRNDGIAGAPLKLDLCTTQQCYMRHNFTAVRTTQVNDAVGAASTAVPGSANLRDGLGSGYGMVETYDCGDLPMTHAVAGFNPAPLNDAYIAEDGTASFALNETEVPGIYIAVGFPGQAATASTAIDVVGAVGAKRDDTCTEEFGGRSTTIFPDSLSVLRSGPETVLHGM